MFAIYMCRYVYMYVCKYIKYDKERTLLLHYNEINHDEEKKL